MAKLDLNPVKAEIVKQGFTLNFSTSFTVYYRNDIAGQEFAIIKIIDNNVPKGLVTVMPEYYNSYEQIAREIIKVLKEAQ